MENVSLIIKGLIIGLGKIIPGVSGSVLAISLNVYEKAIYSISNIFKDIKNIFYLGYLGIGILISIILGSKVLLFIYTKYYFYTFSLIIGLIIGTIPNLSKKVKFKNIKDLLYITIPFIILILLNNLDLNISTNKSILLCFIIGLIEAITTIIPGISSTAIYISFDMYNTFLNIFSDLFTFNFIIFSIGIFIGIYLTSKLITFLFSNYKRETYLVIISFLLSSIFLLIKDIIKISNFNIIAFLLFLSIGFVISKYFDK